MCVDPLQNPEGGAKNILDVFHLFCCCCDPQLSLLHQHQLVLGWAVAEPGWLAFRKSHTTRVKTTGCRQVLAVVQASGLDHFQRNRAPYSTYLSHAYLSATAVVPQQVAKQRCGMRMENDELGLEEHSHDLGDDERNGHIRQEAVRGRQGFLLPWGLGAFDDTFRAPCRGSNG